MSDLTRRERNAVAVVRKSIGSHGLAYTVDNDLIALLPQSIVYHYFKNLMRAFKKEPSIRQVNAVCRAWYTKAVPTPYESILLYFLEICAHEFSHFRLNHSERVDRGEISQRQAEAEADAFQYRVAEMLRWVETADALFEDEKARLKETGVL